MVYPVILFASIASLLLVSHITNLNFDYEEFILYFVLLFGIVVLSVFPLGGKFQSLSFIAVPFIFFSYYLTKLKIEKIIFLRIGKKHDAKSFLLFLIPFLVSVVIINSSDFINLFGLLKIVNFFLVGFFFTSEIPKLFSKYSDKFKRFLNFIVYFGTINSVAGIITYFIPSLATKGGFANGFFINPNTNAFFTIFSITVTLYFIFFEFKEKVDFQNKIKFYVFLLFLLINMLLTYSRAGYVGTLVSVLILLFLHSKKKFFLILPVIAFLVVKFISLMSLKGGSTFARLGLIYAAFEMLKSSNQGLMWGFGTISVFEKFEAFKSGIGEFFDPVNYPHNFILFYIMQFGLISLIPIFIYFSGYLIKSFKYLIKRNKFQNNYFVLFFTIFVTIFIQSLFEDTILFPQYFVYPMFLVFFGYLRLYIIDGLKTT